MPHDFDTNHHFTGFEQAEYDSLSAKGRTAYDKYRWYDKDTHNDAFTQAYEVYGLKNSILLTPENWEALARRGIVKIGS